ncbi:MAG: tRNA (adenosine(37)-N6)-dimethylallyltransferase MiaA [Chloroflexota bacterium]
MKRLIAIVGPTAVGKSNLALHLATALDGEIVVADSRQVYRFMDIGTAKPSREEQALVPYHLIDIVNPNEDFSLALYQEMAYKAVEDIQNRNKLAIIEGGTGLYVWAVLEGFSIPAVPPDPEFRRSLETRAKAQGHEVLYRELQEKDPTTAERIDRRNVRRVIRALEVRRAIGASIPHQRRLQPRWQASIVGLTMERNELYRRIDSRVERMLEQGFVEEVRWLLKNGYGLELPAMSSPGYREIGSYLRGETTFAEAIWQTKTHTHRLARHQYAWFRLTDKRISWYDVDEGIDVAAKIVAKNVLNLEEAQH